MTEVHDRLAVQAAAQDLWPRLQNGEASLEEVRALALRAFDVLGVKGLDSWEKHHFVWVLKGLSTSRHAPGAGLYTALHGVEQALAPQDAREALVDPSLDALDQSELRDWVAAA